MNTSADIDLKKAASCPAPATENLEFPTYSASQEPCTELMRSYLGYLVRRLDNKIHNSFLTELGKDDITPARYTALVIIANNPGVKQVDIARVLEVARPAAMKVVNHLITQGLVEVHALPHDKRAGALALTARGQERLASYERSVRRHEKRIFHALDPDEQQQLLALMNRMIDGA